MTDSYNSAAGRSTHKVSGSATDNFVGLPM
eukprot:COSAG02_NODE_37253_length_444_cov_0.857971_2_plen_29_part_01